MSRPQGFYKRGGKTHPIMGPSGHRRGRRLQLPRRKPTKTMFGPPKDMALAALVRGDTPAHARESVSDLEKKFRESKTRDEKMKIWRATELEANRLQTEAERRREGGGYWESEDQRRESLEASRIFRAAADRMHGALPPGGREPIRLKLNFGGGRAHGKLRVAEKNERPDFVGSVTAARKRFGRAPVEQALREDREDRALYETSSHPSY